MRTGNAILGSFFLAMGFFYPIFLFWIIQKYNIDIRQLFGRLSPPIVLSLSVLLILLFAIFLALGILCIVLGWERRKKYETEEDEIELEEDETELELFK